jgi:hypothetical protein
VKGERSDKYDTIYINTYDKYNIINTFDTIRGTSPLFFPPVPETPSSSPKLS